MTIENNLKNLLKSWRVSNIDRKKTEKHVFSFSKVENPNKTGAVMLFLSFLSSSCCER